MLTTSILDSRRTRLKLLHHQIAELERRNQMAAPIPVHYVRGCAHPECGSRMPNLHPGSDALIIKLGCKHASPTQHLSEDA